MIDILFHNMIHCNKVINFLHLLQKLRRADIRGHTLMKKGLLWYYHNCLVGERFLHIWLHQISFKFTRTEAKFVSSWQGDIVDYGIGLSYRPTSLCSLAGRYYNPICQSGLIPQSGTKNLASVDKPAEIWRGKGGLEPNKTKGNSLHSHCREPEGQF